MNDPSVAPEATQSQPVMPSSVAGASAAAVLSSHPPPHPPPHPSLHPLPQPSPQPSPSTADSLPPRAPAVSEQSLPSQETHAHTQPIASNTVTGVPDFATNGLSLHSPPSVDQAVQASPQRNMDNSALWVRLLALSDEMIQLRTSQNRLLEEHVEYGRRTKLLEAVVDNVTKSIGG